MQSRKKILRRTSCHSVLNGCECLPRLLHHRVSRPCCGISRPLGVSRNTVRRSAHKVGGLPRTPGNGVLDGCERFSCLLHHCVGRPRRGIGRPLDIGRRCVPHCTQCVCHTVRRTAGAVGDLPCTSRHRVLGGREGIPRLLHRRISRPRRRIGRLVDIGCGRVVQHRPSSGVAGLGGRLGG